MIRKILAMIVLITLWGGCTEKQNSQTEGSEASASEGDETQGDKVQLGLVGDAESCMKCHNGSESNDYAGQGLKNPHPFGPSPILCTKCHGGDPFGQTFEAAHVPPPPQIGNWRDITANDVANDADKARAEFNRRTLSGIDKFDIEAPGGYYNVNGVGNYDNGGNNALTKYYAMDYLKFINPGDLRVVTKGEGCGGCHAQEHGEWMANGIIATQTGFFSGQNFAMGYSNDSLESTVFDPLYQSSGSAYGFRARTDKSFKERDLEVGMVPELKENPVYDKHGDTNGIFNNNAYTLNNILNTALDGNNRVIKNSAFGNIVTAAVDNACGDCHLGSAGANNRFGDFRSSGCTSCHMQYAMDGRSKSTDSQLVLAKQEPANPDAIAPGERSHPVDHVIRNVAKLGISGIQDEACVGCHQGSNRTVLQYWGIRLDQNADVVNNFQYPANPNPNNFQNTANNTRLFDKTVNNNTFNGRNANQYLEIEDYDFDGRDDTPADVHFEAGMGCIDCHGSRDLHNGTKGDSSSGSLVSRKNQGVKIECESCHGAAAEYAKTTPCETFLGENAECATDKAGNALKHVSKNQNGDFWLVSKLTGKKHYVTQTLDVIIDNKKEHPITKQPIYTQKGSFAMGRADGKADTGLGPHQAAKDGTGFSHMDNMTCASCHSAWVNNCIGCHIESTYDDDNFSFSNVTGERTVTAVTNATFAYVTPVPFYLGVNENGKISQNAAGMKVFIRYRDKNNQLSPSVEYSSYLKEGNNPNQGGRDAHPGLGFDLTSAHSIRGKATGTKEGARYCVSCHLTNEGLENFGLQVSNNNNLSKEQLKNLGIEKYNEYRNNMLNRNYGGLDFNILTNNIGKNPGNHFNSPLWVHMIAGLGSGLFLFDDQGCPINPLDANDNREYCEGTSPQDRFNATQFQTVKYNLDGLVEPTGVSNVSSIHPMTDNIGVGASLRDGAYDAIMAGPMGKTLIQKLTDPNNGIVLDTYLDANGEWQGSYQQVLDNN